MPAKADRHQPNTYLRLKYHWRWIYAGNDKGMVLLDDVLIANYSAY